MLTNLSKISNQQNLAEASTVLAGAKHLDIMAMLGPIVKVLVEGKMTVLAWGERIGDVPKVVGGCCCGKHSDGGATVLRRMLVVVEGCFDTEGFLGCLVVNKVLLLFPGLCWWRCILRTEGCFVTQSTPRRMPGTCGRHEGCVATTYATVGVVGATKDAWSLWLDATKDAL